MKFPTSFPLEDMAVLIDFFKNREAHSVRDYTEAAYGVGGYALNCMFGGTTKLGTIEVDEDECDPDECQEVLEEAMKECGGVKGVQGAGQASVNWSSVLSVIVAILKELAPLIGGG